MGLLSRLFGGGDPWASVAQPYASALQSRLNASEFERLTALLKTHGQFTPNMFPPDVANGSQRQMCEHVAGMLVHLAFRFADTSDTLNKSKWLQMPASQHPGMIAVRECLALSLALEPTGNPAALMLPGYLLEAGDADGAVAAAAKALPEWEGRFAAGPQRTASATDRPLDAILHEFLSQAGSDASLLDGLRQIATRAVTIRNYADALSDDGYTILRICFSAYLRTRDIAVEPDSASIETFPLVANDPPLLCAFIMSNMAQLRQHLDALQLLRVAHALQPDFANVNEVLADIYARSVNVGETGDEAEEFRRLALHHAGLAAQGMREALASPTTIEETGLNETDLRQRLVRMDEILAQ